MGRHSWLAGYTVSTPPAPSLCVPLLHLHLARTVTVIAFKPQSKEPGGGIEPMQARGKVKPFGGELWKYEDGSDEEW